MCQPIDNVLCPALGREIEIGYCMDLEYATDDMIIWDGIEDRFTDEQMAVCRKCPKREDPAA
jgi:hypothetical protein